MYFACEIAIRKNRMLIAGDNGSGSLQQACSFLAQQGVRMRQLPRVIAARALCFLPANASPRWLLLERTLNFSTLV